MGIHYWRWLWNSTKWDVAEKETTGYAVLRALSLCYSHCIKKIVRRLDIRACLLSENFQGYFKVVIQISYVKETTSDFFTWTTPVIASYWYHQAGNKVIDFLYSLWQMHVEFSGCWHSLLSLRVYQIPLGNDQIPLLFSQFIMICQNRSAHRNGKSKS